MNPDESKPPPWSQESTGSDTLRRGHTLLLSVITRDIFGYLFSGIIFLVALEIFFGPLKLREDIVGGYGFVLLAIAAAYPIGRFLYAVAALAIEVSPLSFDELYPKQYETLVEGSGSESESQDENNGVPLDGKSLLGIKIRKESARTVFGHLMRDWIVLNKPELYYVSFTRDNTLRIVSETSLGLVMSLVAMWVIRSFVSGFHDWKIAFVILFIFALVLFLLLINSHRLRMSQIKEEIYSSYVVARENGKIGQNKNV